MTNKVALITGISGQDAKTLTHYLLSKNYVVVGTYRRNTQQNLSSIRNLFEDDLKNHPHSQLILESCDITDRNSIEECVKTVLEQFSEINEFYHLASQSHVGNSFKQKEYTISATGMSNYYILETLRNYSPKTKFYGALTSELAGNVPEGFIFNEETIWNPKSPYSIAKALGGHWIKFYRESTDSKLFACFGILFNHSNVYRTDDFFIRKVTKAAARISLGLQKELKLGNLAFARDEHLADFGVMMMHKMLQNNEPKDYVIGNGVCRYGEEFLDFAFGYFNLDWKKYVILDKDLLRPNEVVRLVADPSKAEKELGWKRNLFSFKNHIDLMCSFDYELASGKNPKFKSHFHLYPNEKS